MNLINALIIYTGGSHRSRYCFGVLVDISALYQQSLRRGQEKPMELEK